MFKSDQESIARDTKFIFITILLMLALNVPASLFALGWKSAAFNTGLVCVVYAIYIAKTRSAFLLGWAVTGVAAGFTELAADWWLVNRTKSLVYAPDEPFLVASPMYMPFAWALLIMQLGVVAHWLAGRMPKIAAAVTIGLIAGVNIPIYEHLAKDADWWFYQFTPMVYNAPYYIILGEFLIGLPLVWMADHLIKRRPVPTGLVLGIIEGIVIFVAYWIAWALVGPCGGGLLKIGC